MPTRDPSVAFLRAFGAAVRRRRDELEMSQEDFGFKAGLDRTYVSGIERGRRNITLRVVFQVAAALGVHPADLMAEARDLRPTPGSPVARGRIAADRPR